MARGRGPPDDALARVGERLPASPLSVLGGFLAALVVLRTYADAAPLPVDVLVAALPLSVSLGVVAADRYLVEDGVHVRDRMTVFTFALGGFLTAALITGLQLLVVTLRGPPVDESLFLTLVGGTIGVAAGTVAGVAEVRQREATRQAQRERERLEEFASVVSHDLRNPLTISMGYVDLLRERHDDPELEEIADANDRMQEIVDDTLRLARFDTESLDEERVSLEAAATEAWSVVDTGDASLTVDADGSVYADPSRLRTLFENCFRNSVEHGATGDGTDLTVTVERLDDGFAVADDGVGIPDDVRDDLFETGVTSTEDGTGFGLTIVDRVADDHGWTVSVADDVDGARFEVRGVDVRDDPT